MDSQAEVRVPFSGQHWGQLKAHGGVRGWSLGATSERPDQEPSFVEAAFEGLVPRVHVHGSSVEVGYTRWAWVSWGRSQRGQLDLSAKIPWSIVISGGVSRLHAQLGEVRVTGLTIHGGVSDALLELSEPRGVVPIRIHGGVERLTIVRPHAAAISVRTTGGSSDVRLDETFLESVGGQLMWQTNPHGARDYYDVQITGGASRFIVARDTPPLCSSAAASDTAASGSGASQLASCAM